MLWSGEGPFISSASTSCGTDSTCKQLLHCDRLLERDMSEAAVNRCRHSRCGTRWALNVVASGSLTVSSGAQGRLRRREIFTQCRVDRTSGHLTTFGAGTIIRERYGLAPRLSRKSRAGPPGPQETERNRESPTSGNRCPSSSAAARRRYRYRSAGDRVTPWCSCLRSGLSSGAFGILTVGSAASTYDPLASKQAPYRAAEIPPCSTSTSTNPSNRPVLS